MKKISIIIIVFVLIVGLGFIYREATAKAQIQSTLTERSKEYLKKQNSDALKYADLEAKDATRSANVVVDNCFSFVIPFPVSSSRTDARCEVTYGIPMGGNIIAYRRSASINSFDSVPGVSLRRQEVEKYKEDTKVLNGKTFLIFSNSQDQAKNAFYYEPGFYFVLNMLLPSSLGNDAKFMDMLKTVKFL